MHTKKFLYPLTIKEIYLDTFGHVNNAAYLTLLEEARWELLNEGGYGLKKIQETRIGPTILGVKLSFYKELFARDDIVIESQMTSYQKKIGMLSQKMIRHGDLCCEAEITIGLFSLIERKLILPTPEWLHAIGLNSIGEYT